MKNRDKERRKPLQTPKKNNAGHQWEVETKDIKLHQGCRKCFHSSILLGYCDLELY